MFINEYVAEKLRELDDERLALSPAVQHRQAGKEMTSPATKPVIGPVVRFAGKTLRRAGEGLEGWASGSQREAEQRWAERHLG